MQLLSQRVVTQTAQKSIHAETAVAAALLLMLLLPMLHMQTMHNCKQQKRATTA
jgi:hypothetical protein